MLGLVAYDSSSEEEVSNKPILKTKQEMKASQVEASKTLQDRTQETPSAQAAVQETVLDRAPSGPVLGPAHKEIEEPSEPNNGQLSPLRKLIHDLTLPPVPNLDIPPSPPGSPSPSVNAKFAHFLSLKKQNVHFNEKLAGSASLKNPSLLKKMMEHAGIDEQSQYSCSLPPYIWDMSNLPSWGYKEDLLRAQKELSAIAEEKRAKTQRDAIEFVNSASSRSDSASLNQSRPR